MMYTNSDVFLRLKEKYQKSTKRQKTGLLDAAIECFNKSRKHLIRLFNRIDSTNRKRRPGKPRTYTAAVEKVIVGIWEDSGCPCARNLRAMLKDFLPFYEKYRFPVSGDVKYKVLKASVSALKRILKPYHAKHRGKGISTTRSRRSPLQAKIPIRTGQWEINEPGHLEADLVANCGSNASEGFIYTLNSTDIYTQWASMRPVRSKREEETKRAIADIEATLPFDLKGIDVDNGSEFINEVWFSHFTERAAPVLFTRSRAYKKNDNAHIEQKNFQNIRLYLGYARLETDEQYRVMESLMKNELPLYINFFLPSVRLIAKDRIGSKLRKRYDAPQTPYQRVLACSSIPEKKKEQLRTIYKRLDPYLLLKSIHNKMRQLYKDVRTQKA